MGGSSGDKLPVKIIILRVLFLYRSLEPTALSKINK